MLLQGSNLFVETTTASFPCFHTTYCVFLEVNFHEDDEAVGEDTSRRKWKRERVSFSTP